MTSITLELNTLKLTTLSMITKKPVLCAICGVKFYTPITNMKIVNKCPFHRQKNVVSTNIKHVNNQYNTTGHNKRGEFS